MANEDFANILPTKNSNNAGKARAKKLKLTARMVLQQATLARKFSAQTGKEEEHGVENQNGFSIIGKVDSAPSNGRKVPTRFSDTVQKKMRVGQGKSNAWLHAVRKIKSTTGNRGDEEDNQAPVLEEPQVNEISSGKTSLRRSIQKVIFQKKPGFDKKIKRSKRHSLIQVLKSNELKEYIAKSGNNETVLKMRKRLPQSEAMKNWALCAENKRQLALKKDEDEVDDVVEDLVSNKSNSVANGKQLLMEESCRSALARNSENRSHMDLQALKTWFQRSKLQLSTDFENLQPLELDLLCRRMQLITYYSNEIVFKQGDEGDALFIVFSGAAEVRVSQNVLGELVEVTVCELTKGEFFGERALLNNEPRGATIVTKTPTELIRISREDYNVMLKQNQQEFLTKMRMANSGIPNKYFSFSSQEDTIKILRKKPDARTKKEIEVLSQYVQNLKFFRGIPSSFTKELCGVVELLSMGSNTTVFREGETGDLFYVILSGCVDIKITSKNSKGMDQQTKLINLTEGAHFGELALIKGHGVRSATVVTHESCEFLVLCEKDYNNILHKVQKEDLAKRIDILLSIPMFQTPEWTPRLLEEVSYILSEQRMPAGKDIFKQGEKAQQVVFITRGECFLTRNIPDPHSGQLCSIVVDRIGPYHVIGDDAAFGKNFNETSYRSETATTTTPVEMFFLSRYDVFHRLSASARDTLRAHTKYYLTEIQGLDSFYKTRKWEAYKKKLLLDKINFRLIDKIYEKKPPPQPPQHPKELKLPKQAKIDDINFFSHRSRSKRSSSISVQAITSSKTTWNKRTMLVDNNDLLLLDHVPNVDKLLPNMKGHKMKTFSQLTMSYNPDISPVNPNQRIINLNRVAAEEKKNEKRILNEGNPNVYLDKLKNCKGVIPLKSIGEESSDTSTGDGDSSMFSIVRQQSQVDVKPNVKDHRKGDIEVLPGQIYPQTGERKYNSTPQNVLILSLNDKSIGQGEIITDGSLRISTPLQREMRYFYLPLQKNIWLAYDLRKQKDHKYCEDKINSTLDQRINNTTATTSKTKYHLQRTKSKSNDTIGFCEEVDKSTSRTIKMMDCKVACVTIEPTNAGNECCINVHGCFATSKEATEYLLEHQRRSQLEISILPFQKWISLDEALHPPYSYRPQRKNSISQGNVLDVKSTAATTDWKKVKQREQKLHQLVVQKLGQKLMQETDIPEDGYTQKATLTLEQKFAALEDLLNQQQNNPLETFAKLKKFKRFGAIMKTRIGGSASK